jgi:hypothetical protein
MTATGDTEQVHKAVPEMAQGTQAVVQNSPENVVQHLHRTSSRHTKRCLVNPSTHASSGAHLAPMNKRVRQQCVDT